METYILKIYRGRPGKQYWEEFELPFKTFENVISALMAIQANPINRKGERVEPVVWEQGCLEEVCGSCSMLIDGRPRQACTARIETLLKKSNSNTVTLAPFSKFPLIRDLIVDRTVMFENLKKVEAWVDVDGTFERGFGPDISPEKQQMRYSLSNCMTCGCCVEACPQTNARTNFVGPQIIAQVELFNSHPIGALQKHKRLHKMMEKGGISDCGNAQNCVKVCPKNIPLTDAIAAVSRDTTLEAFHEVFGLPGRE